MRIHAHLQFLELVLGGYPSIHQDQYDRLTQLALADKAFLHNPQAHAQQKKGPWDVSRDFTQYTKYGTAQKDYQDLALEVSLFSILLFMLLVAGAVFFGCWCILLCIIVVYCCLFFYLLLLLSLLIIVYCLFIVVHCCLFWFIDCLLGVIAFNHFST